MFLSLLLCFCLFFISCDSKESSLPIEGCIDSSACNFNSFAEIDDGSCIESNECSLCNECDVDVGSIYLTEDQELWYHIDSDIYGFQFDIYGITITNITNGNAQTSGLDIVYENGTSGFSRVLGYSTDSSKITTDCGILIGISFTGNIQDINNIIFATAYGNQIQVNYQSCQ